MARKTANRIIVIRGNAKKRTQNVNQLLLNIGGVLGSIDEAAASAAHDAASRILLETLPFVPMSRVPNRAGALRASGHVVVLTKGKSKKDRKLQAEVTFGDATVDYAAFVHEDKPRGVVKNYTTPGTGNKYLVKGAAKAAPAIIKIFANEMKSAGL